MLPIRKESQLFRNISAENLNREQKNFTERNNDALAAMKVHFDRNLALSENVRTR